jgi:tetratricopeptide (TPR) repeat protein
MKKSVILLIVACGVIAGALIYLNRPKTAPALSQTVESTPTTPAQAPAEKMLVAAPDSPTPSTNTAVPVAAVAPVVAETNAPENAISKAVDALLAAHGGKHEMFEQLRKDGKLDAVIAELQKRAAADPTDAEIPTTLGEAMLNKVKALHDSGDTDPTDLGVWALQADQNFNAALKIDPQNWEAQFVKYSSMTYWPSDPQRDASVVQHLSSLIDQQEGMPQTSGFAQTYIALGKEYEKMGKPDEAMATWQLGLQKFPGDATLLDKTRGH